MLLQVNQGSLYPALLRLEDRGWVTSEWGMSENNRRARFYTPDRGGTKQLQREADAGTGWPRLMARLLGGAPQNEELHETYASGRARRGRLRAAETTAS